MSIGKEWNKHMTLGPLLLSWIAWAVTIYAMYDLQELGIQIFIFVLWASLTVLLILETIYYLKHNTKEQRESL